MKRPRIYTVFRQLFNRPAIVCKTRDIETLVSLTWFLASLGIKTTSSNPVFNIELGYLSSQELEANLRSFVNLSYKKFTEEDLKRLQILKEILNQFKNPTQKEDIIQGTATYSALRQIASDLIAKEEFIRLCPKFKNVETITYETYNNLNLKLNRLNKNLLNQQENILENN